MLSSLFYIYNFNVHLMWWYECC